MKRNRYIFTTEAACLEKYPVKTTMKKHIFNIFHLELEIPPFCTKHRSNPVCTVRAS